MNIIQIAKHTWGCFIHVMSTEKIFDTEQNASTLTIPKINEEKFNGVVDINRLLAKVRKEEKKAYKMNLFFFGMFLALILIVGILLSL
jgi:hypothetical protein